MHRRTYSQAFGPAIKIHLPRQFFALALVSVLIACAAGAAVAAPANRITAQVDTTRVRVVPGSLPRLAKPQFDQGAVDPGMPVQDIMLLTKPSAAQQAELDGLLADQQNPSSPRFHQWLTPEEFGARFGLSASDHSKVVAWLSSQGFDIRETGRARNWIRFNGTARQVENALHTQIHHYQVNGETHFANSAPVNVPEALAGVVGGFAGLNDFRPRRMTKTLTPDFNSGTSHFLVPADFATIYDAGPLSDAGIDGTGVNIGIIGDSQIQISDIQAFRTKYKLPANDPKPVLAGTNPGLTGDIIEADLDIEWAGAVAPGATIYYYYSTSLTTAITSAVNANLVQLISISFGGAEIDDPTLSYQPVLQQANAQGITVFASAGDSGAATFPDSGTFSRFGPAVSWPASYPEVTAVGGTQFNDATGTWWATTNGASSGSALSYIPEIAWSGGGGGASIIFPKPVWQNAPGVPQDQARDLPDVSLSASTHDAYEIYTLGLSTAVGGTSASSPSMAGIIALLNHYLVSNGQLSQPGLGNINPQLYRMAQSSPSAFHDITAGGNAVSCRNGTPGCIDGTFGFNAAAGYDLATGIGSIDVNSFVTQWNSSTNGVNVTFSVSPAKGTFNDTFQLSATVTPASGTGTPTGVVDFSTGAASLGSATLDPASGVAGVSVPGYLFTSANTFTLSARYNGDTAFSGGGATSKVQIVPPTGVSAIVPSVPVSVAATSDPTGLVWSFTMALLERGGVASVLTGVNLDGQDVPVSQFFPSPSIPANGSITSARIMFRNLAYPLVRTFIFSGLDATGQQWSRQAKIKFLSPATNLQAVIFSAIPLVVQQDPAASADCQWSQQLVLTDISGYGQTITNLMLGNISIADRIPAIFGTAQLAPYGSLQGTLCWNGAVAGATDTISLVFSAGWTQDLAVSFAGPAANPSPVSVSPTTLALSSMPNSPAQGTLSLSVPDGQSWSIGVSPQNITSGWLSLSQAAGTGPALITVSASGSGFAPGAYLANLVIQGPNMTPAAITVPVTFVNGDSTGVTITSLTNAASGQSVAAPGMIAIIKGTNLPGTPFSFSNGIFGFSQASTTITVNGIPAAFSSSAAGQVKFQIPYETSSGTAVFGISSQGKVGAYVFQVAPTAPGIFTDANGSAGTVQAGKSINLTMTGDGVTNPAIGDGIPGSSLTSYKPALPFTLTIGGAPAFLNSYGIASGAYSTTTLSVSIPKSAATGVQQVVVTVAGVSSPPVNLTITP